MPSHANEQDHAHEERRHNERAEHEHREEHHYEPPPPERRRWSLEALVALAGFLFSVLLAVISLAGVGYLAVYRIGELDTWKKDHLADQKEAAKALDARISKIEDTVHSNESTTDHRMTAVEHDLAAILERLTSIDHKLDAPDGRHH